MFAFSTHSFEIEDNNIIDIVIHKSIKQVVQNAYLHVCDRAYNPTCYHVLLSNMYSVCVVDGSSAHIY